MSHFPPVISAVTAQDIPAVLDFVLAARAELFPKLRASAMPDDLARFAQVYLDGGGCFLLARDQARIIGAIGYLPYDGRFAGIQYPGRAAVELVRLFVLPEYRRSGVAGALYRALLAHAHQMQVQVIYLHTHPFLPGAIGFWERQGFSLLRVDPDPEWQTTHMDYCLPA